MGRTSRKLVDFFYDGYLDTAIKAVDSIVPDKGDPEEREIAREMEIQMNIIEQIAAQSSVMAQVALRAVWKLYQLPFYEHFGTADMKQLIRDRTGNDNLTYVVDIAERVLPEIARRANSGNAIVHPATGEIIDDQYLVEQPGMIKKLKETSGFISEQIQKGNDETVAQFVQAIVTESAETVRAKMVAHRQGGVAVELPIRIIRNEDGSYSGSFENWDQDQWVTLRGRLGTLLKKI